MEPEAEIIRTQLFALRDETYRTFHSALMPTVPPETVIGVRVPALRRLAKQLAGTAQAEVFLQALPHGYYEENNLHAFLIELIRDYDRALAETEAFLPYINNWATCDCFCPKVFAKHKKELLVPIRRWLDSGEVYTVRYGMEMLMRYYLDDAFRPEYLEWVADVRSTEYYINMMRAWYFATALAKQPDAALPCDMPFLLAGGPIQFNMLVCHWASLGYLTIFCGKNARVALRRRVDMGNERRPAEVKLFQMLFSQGDVCEGASLLYKRTAEKADEVLRRY